METPSAYSIVPLSDGRFSVRSELQGETFHPKVGPEVEARCVYFNPMHMEKRITESEEPVCVWDVGLGSAGNAINLIRQHAHIEGKIELHSFDSTLDPIKFALKEAPLLGYMHHFESHVMGLIQQNEIQFQWGKLNVKWYIHLGDLRNGYPKEIGATHSPDAVLYDPYSPAKNPELWSLKAFECLRKRLGSRCTLATYSRSTSVRVAMLCAGFFVVKGGQVGEKEETTVAATHPEFIDDLLDDIWLKRVINSTNAEPIVQIPHRRSSVQQETWLKLVKHPQFEKYSFASELPMRH